MLSKKLHTPLMKNTSANVLVYGWSYNFYIFSQVASLLSSHFAHDFISIDEEEVKLNMSTSEHWEFLFSIAYYS